MELDNKGIIIYHHYMYVEEDVALAFTQDWSGSVSLLVYTSLEETQLSNAT